MQVDFLNKKERTANMQRILNALSPDEHSFNSMLLGFMDIIRTEFYHYQANQYKDSQKELEEFHRRVEKAINDVSNVLNNNGLTNSEDMLALSMIMLEAINSAMLRQQEHGLSVKRKI